ncbi:probable endochitinase [Anopheles funestus]|uniref:probable endochitinase n=1 Tax=Anopheles funestus TaxID=62324 RepID=UPI0020C6F546|nr:probable endochitinase [Anopheles funestus]
MIVLPMKYVTLGLVLIVSILANPGDHIPNHPNCPDVQGPIPVYFVHPTNCSRFYECKDKTAWELECSAGLHFNTKINVCDYPENAQCESQSTHTTTMVISTTTSTFTTLDHTTTIGTTTECDSTIPTTTIPSTTTPYPWPEHSTTSAQPPSDGSTPTSYSTTDGTSTTSDWTDITTTYRPPTEGGTPKPNCPPFGATQPNYWADSSDCSRYLGCLENCVQKFKCPDGLYWNDEQKRCDSFGNSQCCPVIPPAPNVWTTD